ncbi:hypothetical protein HY086_04045 [Candidatus Gottesmanbacteria bacterium]|nr:hypothetical protein [Candidatus Gottesmanbacteria bacterium]
MKPFLKLFILLPLFFLAAAIGHSRLIVQSVKTQETDPRSVWQREIADLTRSRGVAQALAYVATRSRTDQAYQAVCHELMHEVGHQAYRLFLKENRVSVTTDGSACAFGFYHGVMEAWIGKGGDKSKAIAFCTMVDKTLGQSKNSFYQCWHGIGHGAVVPHERKLWGNPDGMVAPALTVCARMASPGPEFTNCKSGVYAGVAIFIMENQYGLDLQSADPLALCESEHEEGKIRCIGSMMPALFKQWHHDMGQTWNILEERLPKALLVHAANALGSSAAIERITLAIITAGCEHMGHPYSDSCLTGYKETQELL